MTEGYTKISTNFDVRIAKPIDARFAVGTLAERDAMVHAYEGLSLYVEENKTLYVLTALPASEAGNWQPITGGGPSADISFDGSRPIRTLPQVGQVGGGTNLLEFLERAYYAFRPAQIGIGGVPLQEKGTTVTLNLQVNVTAEDETTFSNGRIEDATGNVVATFTASPGTQTATPITGIMANQTYTAKLDVANNGEPETLSANRSVIFVAPTYYGVGAAGLAEPDIKAMTKVLRQRSDHNNVPFSPTNERFYYAYPNSYGAVARIIDPNNFDVTASFNARQESFALADSTPEAYRIMYNNADTTQTDFRLDFDF